MTTALFGVITAVLIITGGGDCLKLVRLAVPPYKLRGELAILECHYELEGDNLYAVKWYKENEEFYRYVPKSSPPQVSYKVEGIKVDHQLSDSQQVALRGVTLRSSGTYRCEVSAEAPSFASANREARMEILYLPSHGPHITGDKKQYMIGDEINLNCTSAKSYPASLLHWYINDQQVLENEGAVSYPNTVHAHGLMTSVLGLRLKVQPRHFPGNTMRLRCVASLSPVLWQGDRTSVVQSYTPLLLENREAMLLVRGGGRKIEASGMMLLMGGVLCFILVS